MTAIPAYPAPRGLLKDRTVVVTAAAGTGIGFAVAKRAAEEGARVLISDFHERRLGEAADAIAAAVGARPETCLCDVTSEEQVQALRDTALAKLGHVDVLINNAGLGGEVPVVEMTDAQWSRVIDVTLTSVFRMTRAFLPAMTARAAGAIVNNASVLGWRAQKGQAHYAAAKAGVMAFTRCAAVEAAEHGVRINAVAPSIAMHPFLAKVTTDDLLAKLSAQEAFGRPAEVWEVANVMIFLASDLSSYMTGEIVSVSSQRA
ncbi:MULTISPECIES: SDR family oxidoreductase [unclassified Sphingomonas]|uniref:SDR family oxidoreductase n=1 Tax=unclassified Sphingomonas TaxID=196159 RepID=UPI0009290D37|nr:MULTISPECIES: SDR family oxidoreductase [unclassified Sphingomonas]MBN8848109.1 SDR family oxidoreductase [Sphingomonas sp.]OJV31875.1 MAG: short chain dehydrogenase [Sphingomonas sp. 67-36]